MQTIKWCTKRRRGRKPNKQEKKVPAKIYKQSYMHTFTVTTATTTTKIKQNNNNNNNNKQKKKKKKQKKKKTGTL